MVLGEGGLAELSGCKDSVMRKRPRPAYVVNKQRFCGFHTNAFVAFTCVRVMICPTLDLSLPCLTSVLRGSEGEECGDMAHVNYH